MMQCIIDAQPPKNEANPSLVLRRVVLVGKARRLPQAMTAWIKESGIGWVEFLLVVNLLLAGK